MASKRPNGCKRQDGAFLPPLKRQKLAGKRDDEELKEETDHEYMARRHEEAEGNGRRESDPIPNTTSCPRCGCTQWEIHRIYACDNEGSPSHGINCARPGCSGNNLYWGPLTCSDCHSGPTVFGNADYETASHVATLNKTIKFLRAPATWTYRH